MCVAKKDDLSLFIQKMIPFTDGFVYLITPPCPQKGYQKPQLYSCIHREKGSGCSLILTIVCLLDDMFWLSSRSVD